jgi:putative aminopeptidase FrvX
VVYAPHAERLGQHRVSGTFVDNRNGCLVLLETLAHLHGHRPRATVHVVPTVQWSSTSEVPNPPPTP